MEGILSVYFILEQLRVFIYKSFVSLCCVYLGAAPVALVQDSILNPHNP